jgi:hypothetical protein
MGPVFLQEQKETRAFPVSSAVYGQGDSPHKDLTHGHLELGL